MSLFDMSVSETQLFDSLERLNEISRNINQLITGSAANVDATLEFIVQSATEVVPDSSAVIYAYDESSKKFDLDSRVSFEGVSQSVPDDYPRPGGMGSRAVQEKRRIISSEEDIDIHPRKVATGAQEMICYPLMLSDEVLGVLYVYLHNRRSFNELELLLLDNYVNQAAITLSLSKEKNQGLQDQVRRGKELRRLRRAGTLISSRTGLQDTFDTILQYALEVMDAQYGILRLVDDSGENLVTQAIIGLTPETAHSEKLPIDKTSIMGSVAIDRVPQVIPDLREAPWNELYYPLDESLEMRSEVAVPLLGASNRLEGVLNLESPHPNAFSKSDRYILQIFATQAVSAIQEARLIDALQEVSAYLLTQSQQEVLEHLVEQACNLLNTSVGLIWVIEENLLTLKAATDARLQGEQVPIESTFTGQVILSGQPTSSSNLLADPFFSRKDLAEKHQWGSALSVPIFTDGDEAPVGVFSIYTQGNDKRAFSTNQWDTKVMSILAHYAALAIQNAAHQKALRTAQEQQAVTEMFAIVGDVAANLMHRLNNKVGTIPVRVEGVEDKIEMNTLSDEYLVRNLDEIKNSSTEAMRIVQESLFHLKPVSLTPVHIGDCVTDAIKTVTPPKKIKLGIQGMEDLPLILADRTRLALVFTNLLENAIAVMGASGSVDIYGAIKDDWIEIRFSDTGPGIPPELHEQIFEFRYSGRHSEHPGKLGFGLWWVKTLMVRMKGVILIESDGKSGTSFIMRFPHIHSV